MIYIFLIYNLNFLTKTHVTTKLMVITNQMTCPVNQASNIKHHPIDD